MMEELKDD